MGKNTERRRERKAYHEAGHVVASILLKLSFESVSLREKQEIWYDLKDGEKVPCTHIYTEGITWTEERLKLLNEDQMNAKLDLREAIATMAGPEAEKKYIGGSVDEEARFGANLDLQAIFAPCRAAISPGLPVEQWKISVMEQKMVNALAMQANALLTENWACVEAIADALIKYRSLTYDETEKIINNTRKSGPKSVGIPSTWRP